jgi:hypothetical protein
MLLAGESYWRSDVIFTDLRSFEREMVSYKSVRTQENFIAIYDLRSQTKNEATFGMISTLVVCCVLMISTAITTKTNNHLLIHPIEKMIKKV